MSKYLKAGKGGDPLAVYPPARALLIELAARYRRLREALEEARDGFAAVEGVELFIPPRVGTRSPRRMAEDLDVVRRSMPRAEDFGPNHLFALLCGVTPVPSRTPRLFKAFVLRELGPEGFEAVRPILEFLRQRRRDYRAGLVALEFDW